MLTRVLTFVLIGTIPFPAAVGQTTGNTSPGRSVVVGAASGGRQTACMSCHGIDGKGDAVAIFPRIAGQPAAYLHKTLEDYANGRRENAVMSPIARALTFEERLLVSDFYATQSAPPSTVLERRSPPADLQRGGVLSAIGDSVIGVQACQNCHGPQGLGMGSMYPYLAGQHGSYITRQLQLWQSGQRGGDAQNIMANIAKKLTDADVRAVSAYFASLPPPGASQAVKPAEWSGAPNAPTASSGETGGRP